jgi:AcrR family transcriptional regulator
VESPAASPTAPRGRILSAAAAVFAHRGFNGGSLTDIATGADMTRPGVLHHYPSKQAVLLALLDQRDRDLQALLPNATHWMLSDTLAYLKSVSAAVLHDRELVRLAHTLTAEASDVDHPARPWVLRRQRLVRADFERAITNSQQAGEIEASVDPVALAGAMLGAIEGIENQWLVDPEFDVAAAIEMHCSLVAGLLVSPSK